MFVAMQLNYRAIQAWMSPRPQRSPLLQTPAQLPHPKHHALQLPSPLQHPHQPSHPACHLRSLIWCKHQQCQVLQKHVLRYHNHVIMPDDFILTYSRHRALLLHPLPLHLPMLRPHQSLLLYLLPLQLQPHPLLLLRLLLRLSLRDHQPASCLPSFQYGFFNSVLYVVTQYIAGRK